MCAKQGPDFAAILVVTLPHVPELVLARGKPLLKLSVPVKEVLDWCPNPT
ncbi:MAG: hypothetical protein RMI49_01565 [Candidatus Caldarchaeum sp.]|nr:hypothetical protein [Candidatus Caldarchaeum sp.]